MARYGTIHDGINDYQFSTDSNLDLSASSSWAFCFFVKLETKATPFHYLLSTGAFDLNNLNFYFSSSTNTLGYNSTGVSYSTTATFADIFTTEYFVGIIQDGGDFKVMTCPVGSTAAVETIATGQSAQTKTGKTWQWMRRGDGNADRYAKGTFSNPIRLSAPPTLAQFEAVANGADPITEFGANLVVNWDFSTGTGTSSTDTEVSAVITQSGMPTDNSQWTLIVPDGSGISATITETLEPFSDSISVAVSANISAAITETLEPFSDSISASISGAVSASITESLQPFSDSISADISANISIALTEELQPFADSISATVTPAVGINAAITETLQPFSDSIAADVSANISAAITEQLQPFADSIGVNLSANIELTITETLDAFSDSISVQMPQVVISSKNTVRIKPRNNTIRVQSRNKTMRVR